MLAPPGIRGRKSTMTSWQVLPGDADRHGHSLIKELEPALTFWHVMPVTMDLPLPCITQMEALSPSQAPARPIHPPWQAQVDRSHQVAIPDQEPLEQAVVL